MLECYGQRELALLDLLALRERAAVGQDGRPGPALTLQFEVGAEGPAHVVAPQKG